MERLGHGIAAGRGRDEGTVGRRVLGREPRSERRPEIPGDPLEVAPRSVRSIALRIDPLVPVVERRRRRLYRHLAGPRIDPGGLVEVGVNGETAAGHGRAAASGAETSARTVTRWSTRSEVRSPGASAMGRNSRMALPW